MNQQQIQQLRKALEDELAQLQEHIHEEPTAEDTELSSVDNHPADVATDITTVTTEIALDELKENEIEKIERALKAMNDGSYGKCSECGEIIPFERLVAIPTALTCIVHTKEE